MHMNMWMPIPMQMLMPMSLAMYTQMHIHMRMHPGHLAHGLAIHCHGMYMAMGIGPLRLGVLFRFLAVRLLAKRNLDEIKDK